MVGVMVARPHHTSTYPPLGLRSGAPLTICTRLPASTNCAAYLAVADEAYGRQIPFAFLERVCNEFEEKFAAQAASSPAHSLERVFGWVGWGGGLALMPACLGCM